MNLNDKSIVFIPDKEEEGAALQRTTHMAIAAHQDDVEFMAFQPISECFGSSEKYFCAVVATDGAGSPRSGIYGRYSDEEMKKIRIREQKKAAFTGEYGSLIMLGHASWQAKDKNDRQIAAELAEILRAARPQKVYIHNLADKHDTHVAVALKAIEAMRMLKPGERPQKVYGCEVWRGLDWLCDGEKVLLDCSAHPNLARSLSGVYDSQIAGGKRYDAAVEGRRIANATFSESHNCDKFQSLNFAMDLTPLIYDENLKPEDFVSEFIKHFLCDVANRIKRLS